MEKRASGVVPSVLYDERYFLHVCEGYQEFLSGEGEYLSRRLAEALARAGIAPGMKVLDVGCGRGEILRSTTALGAWAFGIDYAAAAVRLSHGIAEQEPSGEHPIGVYQASALFLPFEDNLFDRVLMLDIVEHLYPRELDAALREAFRVLKPGVENTIFILTSYPDGQSVETTLIVGVDGEEHALATDPYGLAEFRSHSRDFRKKVIGIWQEAFRRAAEQVTSESGEACSVGFSQGPSFGDRAQGAFRLPPQALLLGEVPLFVGEGTLGLGLLLPVINKSSFEILPDISDLDNENLELSLGSDFVFVVLLKGSNKGFK